MNIMIRPGKLNGEVQVPPSKSYAHRMLICAALAEGKSVLSGIASSEDISATLDCIGALGAECAREKDCVTVKKNLRRESLFLRTGMQLPVFPCRESGSTLRFLIPVSLAVCGGGVITGTTRLIERGIGVFEELFEGSGITIDKARDSLTVKGVLSSGCYRLRGDVSSQFVTGMMFALSLLEEDSTIEVLLR